MFRIAINGLGRIGGATLKILSSKPEMTLVAVNGTTTSGAMPARWCGKRPR
jgi:glyceraldehyde-3-phosphate dehydrogenase/erythrose-4-phosphate dehydrogenase